MYPDWPESASDLVPLPCCDGPKLNAFDFQGPQKIEFLEYLGEGSHAHVFKIKILGQIYALKLFRFAYDEDYLGPDYDHDVDNYDTVSAFYQYSEPFSSECRAFGRLQEAGHEQLAVQCFGYLLLDEEHEQAMMKQFSHLELKWNGSMDYPDREDMRSRFLGKSGRAPPIRGIIKEFGHLPRELRTRDARKILRDIIQLQQLGIVCIDVADRQLINNKICDFSTAVTTPHFATTPELNPHLTPEWIAAIEFETFQFSMSDYWNFDEMVHIWNEEHKDQKNKIAVYAFPGGRGCRTKYDLRRTPFRQRVFSYVDPRLYDWRSPPAGPGNKAARALAGQKKSGQRKRETGSRGAGSRTRLRLDTRPPKWYLNCDDKVAAELKALRGCSTSLRWCVKDGLIFPRKKY
ncbi:hypothetical protein VB005_00362 [Metarhizium brunneum]